MILSRFLLATLGGQGGLAPNQIAGLFAWYNATGITVGDGQAINPWLDNTVNAYNLNWDGDGTNPICKAGANGLNGYSIYDEPAGSGGLGKSSISGGTMDKGTLSFFCVCKWPGINNTTISFTQISGFNSLALNNSSGVISYANSTSGGGDSSSIPSLNTWHIVVVSVNAGTVSLWLDNVLDTSVPSIGTSSGTMSRIVIGESGSSSFVGFIAEVAWFNATIGATNAAGLYHYAKTRYAL